MSWGMHCKRWAEPSLIRDIFFILVSSYDPVKRYLLLLLSLVGNSSLLAQLVERSAFKHRLQGTEMSGVRAPYEEFLLFCHFFFTKIVTTIQYLRFFSVLQLHELEYIEYSSSEPSLPSLILSRFALFYLKSQ